MFDRLEKEFPANEYRFGFLSLLLFTASTLLSKATIYQREQVSQPVSQFTH